MVGRERELRAPARGIRGGGSRTRECRVITVIGTAGIGKSRLVKELLASVRRRGLGPRRPLPPLRQGNHVLAAPRPRPAGSRRAHARADRESCSRASPTRARSRRASRARSESRAARAPRRRRSGRSAGCSSTSRANGRSSSRFDDLQWAEPTFLDLIEYLLGWIRDAPILIVCLARPGSARAAPRLARRSPPNASVDRARAALRAGGRGAARAPRGGATELTADLFARITEAAEGNPLFVEQMLAMLTENGVGLGRPRRSRRRSTLCSPPASTASSRRSAP